MRCRDVMKANVVQCLENDTVHRGAFLMKSWKVGFLPVADREDRVVGVVTDRDLVLRVLAPERPPSTPIGAVMTKDPVVCRPDEEIWLAEEKMIEWRKSRLPVVDTAGRCVGVISLSDLGQIEPRPRAGELLQRIAGRESPAPVRH